MLGHSVAMGLRVDDNAFFSCSDAARLFPISFSRSTWSSFSCCCVGHTGGYSAFSFEVFSVPHSSGRSPLLQSLEGGTDASPIGMFISFGYQMRQTCTGSSTAWSLETACSVSVPCKGLS